MVKIQLVQAYNDTPEGSIVEVEQEVADQLIADGIAIMYTEEVEMAEEKSAIIEAKKINLKLSKKSVQVQEKNMEFAEKSFLNQKDEIVEKHGEFFVGKAFQELAQKSVTGMSEGTAADGGNLLYTAVADVRGIAMAESVAYSKCSKIVLPDKCNSIKVPTDASDPWIVANAPTPTSPAEGAQKTATKLAFGAVTLTPTKLVLYIPTTDELLQDAQMLDSFIRSYAKSKLATSLDYYVLAADGAGMNAISGNVNTTAVTITESGPTLDQVYGMINSVDPRLQAGSEWFISASIWNYCVNAFATAANLFNQLIDVAGKKLVGYPVTVCPCLNDIIIFGNMSQYTIAEVADNNIMSVSEHIRFDYDETVYRLVSRQAGDITYVSKSTADSLEISAFSEGS